MGVARRSNLAVGVLGGLLAAGGGLDVGGRGSLGNLQASARADVRISAVLKTGDPAPAIGPGVTWSSFFPAGTDAVIDQAGRVAFVGSVTGAGVTATNGNVLVTGSTNGNSFGSLRLVARQGDAAPGAGSNVTFLPILPFLLNDGRVAFGATLSGSGVTASNDTGWYVESPGGAPGSNGLTQFLREGDPIPGRPGLTIANNGVGIPYFAVDGSWASAVTVTGTGVNNLNDSVLLLASGATPGAPFVLAREGDSIPGQVGIQYGPFGNPHISTGGRLIVRSVFVGINAPLPTASDEVVLEFPAGSSTPTWTVREGDPIPGRPSPVVWGRIFFAYVTPGDRLTVFADDLGATPTSRTAWVGPPVGTPGNFRPLAPAGAPAPGFPSGAVFGSSIVEKFDVNSAGQAAFFTSATGGGVSTANDNGAFLEIGGGAQLAAREGNVPPGLTVPAVFGPFANSTSTPAFNDRQQAAFWLYAPNPTTDIFSDLGLWVVGMDGQTRLVAHKQSPFMLAPGDTRAVTSLGYRLLTGPQAPARSWFNNSGRLIFTLGFSGGTGAIILADVDPAPACPADFNGVGGVTVQDVFDFLFAWFGGQPTADFNGTGGVTVQDVFDFLTAWFNAC